MSDDIQHYWQKLILHYWKNHEHEEWRITSDNDFIPADGESRWLRMKLTGDEAQRFWADFERTCDSLGLLEGDDE